MNRVPFAPEEWYHCFTRGVERRTTFESVRDYARFMELLYISNGDERIHRSALVDRTSQEIFSHGRGNTLISIGAYSLMPNHFHLLIKEKADGGITTFMRKLGTAYTMYFNIKYQRTGNLFIKPFRSKHIADDIYIQRAF